MIDPKIINKVKKLITVVMLSASGLVLIMGFQNCAGDHSSAGSDEAPSQQELLAGIESAAKAVLSENCAACHSPESTDPNTTFSDVMNTAYLLSEEYMIAGEPQNSPLYMIALDAIPPHETGILNDSEEIALRDWIVSLADPYGTGGVILPPGYEPGGGDAPTYTFIRSTILIPYGCVNCHSSGNSGGNAGVVLDTYEGVRAQVNFDPQDPNFALSSPLYAEINNGTMPVPVTASSAVAPNQVPFVLEWIQAGALNN